MSAIEGGEKHALWLFRVTESENKSAIVFNVIVISWENEVNEWEKNERPVKLVFKKAIKERPALRKGLFKNRTLGMATDELHTVSLNVI